MDNTGTRILIAEDSALQAEGLRRLLAADGYNVFIARDGAEGLAKARELQPDIVISDIVMPEMNGFELCRHIKDDPEISATPVILLTSLSDPADVISGLECGADNFIVKPYDDHHLLSRIRQIQLHRELRNDERTQMGVQISFGGKKYFITSEKKQILDLLISTYESAVQKNIALAEVQEELEKLNEELELRVRERTAELTSEIEERRRIEVELRNSEKFVRNILATVDEAFVVIDPEYRIISANRAYGEQSGQVLENIIGKHCYEISHQATEPCQGPEHVCAHRKTLATGEPGFAVHQHTDALGNPRQVEIKTFPIWSESGQVESVIEVINDVTARVQLEGQLHQAQKMEAIGTLAGGIAHDFNNILSAILGFAELVMEELEPDSRLSADQAQVIAAGLRAKDLVKQILTFSRRTDQELQPLLVQFVVKEALKLLRASIPTSIKFREEIDIDCGLVMADPGQIHQVVMNLCTNGYQAMRETGGVLAVSLQGLKISESEAVGRGNLAPGDYVVLEVSDTGCGMSKMVRERIFEPYFTTKGKGEGTGLGLSLVHGIVSGLGGVVNVYSEPGHGTTFKVYLPLIAGADPGEVEVASEVAPGGEESILVVDDEEAITHLERRILEKLGYRVTEFTASEEALQAFRAAPEGFDLVITDMTMPKLNGDELAREVLRIRPGMPIIICTGFSGLIDPEKAKAMGISEFMLKPVEKAELARAVRRVLDGDSGESAVGDQADLPPN
jgi:PAS domain S-box-containing protein